MQHLSRKLRERFYYRVADAGKMVGFNRAESYRAAQRGDIPTEWRGRFLLVPRKKWDPIAKRLLRQGHAGSRESGRPPAAAAAI
jgi:hypothetical protein